jgi:hypothetical protein
MMAEAPFGGNRNHATRRGVLALALAAGTLAAGGTTGAQQKTTRPAKAAAPAAAPKEAVAPKPTSTYWA